MIRLSKSTITKKDLNSVNKVLKKEYLGMGKEVKLFEDRLTKFFKRKTVCVSSGTSALQLSLEAIGLKEGDEVMVPSLTYVSTYQAITAAKGTPVSIDIDLKDLNFDLSDIKKKITKKTKCIIPVHYAGSVGQLDELIRFSKKNKIRIIEDAAHAFGTRYKKKLIGSFGDIACFSFDGIKNITSGEGGCVVTTDKKVLNHITDARLLGVKKESQKRYKNKKGYNFSVQIQGWRYHMSNIMASIGISQFERKNKIFATRQKLARIYKKILLEEKNIQLLEHDYNKIVPHIFVVKLKMFSKKKRDKLINFLFKKNIETGIHWKPNHILNFFSSKKKIKLKNTDYVYNKILTLPLHLDLNKKKIIYICNQLIKGITLLK